MGPYLFNPDGVQVFIKDGKKVSSLIASGYTPERKHIPTVTEADTNGTGKLSNSEIRDAAKKSGITDHNTRRITSLKEELGYT